MHDDGQPRRGTERLGWILLLALAVVAGLISQLAVSGAPGQVLWVIAAGGAIRQPAVFWRDRVLVGADDGHLYALAVTDGRVLWDLDLGEPLSCPPLVFDDRLYVATADRRLRAVEPAAGLVPWAITLPAVVERPLAACGELLMAADRRGGLHAVGRATGTPTWTIDVTEPPTGGPQTVAADVVAFAYGDGHFEALDSAGRVTWRATPSTLPARGLALDGSRLVGLLDDGSLLELDIHHGATQRHLATRLGLPPAPHGGRWFAVDGTPALSALGEPGQPGWTLPLAQPAVCGPIVVGERLVIIDRARVLRVFDHAGRALWRVDLEADCTAPLAGDGRHVCFGTWAGTIGVVRLP